MPHHQFVVFKIDITRVQKEWSSSDWRTVPLPQKKDVLTLSIEAFDAFVVHFDCLLVFYTK